MIPGFRVVSPEEITDNPFSLILKDWFLITAGPIADFNTMTAGWGGMGALWSRNIVFCVVRPTRYTYQFLEKNEHFTCCFFEDSHKPALQLLGSKSGRDTNKVAESGLTPISGATPGTTAFAEARLIFECRKIYWQDLDPTQFLDPQIEEWYPQKDYHRLYVGEILTVLTRQPEPPLR